MKFTGFASSLALAGFAYSAALPILSDIENTMSGVEGTVANGVVGPILSTAGNVAGSVKRDDFSGLGSTIETIPTIANGAVDIAAGAAGTVENLASSVAGSVEGAVVKRDDFAGLGSTIQAVPSIANGVVKIAAGAVGTGESLASNAVYTAENVVGKASGNEKRQLETLAGPIAGSTAAIVGSAVPAVIQEAGNTVDGALATLTSNPNGLASALIALKEADNIGEITQGQLAQLPVLQSILAVLDL